MKKTFLSLSILFATPILILALVATTKLLAQAQTNNLVLVPNASSNSFLLSWSADSFVPLDYPGRALPTVGSEIKIVVSPIKKLSPDPDKLYYRWLLDNELAGWAAGQGKASFTFIAQRWLGDVHVVEVQILDANNKLLFQRSIEIPIVQPEVLIKKQNDHYAIKDWIGANTGQSVSLIATPLFFSVKNLADINWQWAFSGQNLVSEDQKNPNSLTLKIPEATLSSPIQKSLSLQIANKIYSGQQASIDLNIEIK